MSPDVPLDRDETVAPPPPPPPPPAGSQPTPDESTVDASISEVLKPTTPVPWYGPASLATFVVLVVIGNIGAALYPDWVINHPVWLIASNARMRNLLGALGTGIPPWTFVIVGGIRLALAYVTCHLIGRAYGDRIYYVFGRYLGVTADAIGTMNRMFDKIEWLVVPWFVGSNLVATITGVRRVPGRRLGVLVTVGIVVRLAVLWVTSLLFEDELHAILDWIARYQRPLLIGSVILAVVSVMVNVRRGKNFELGDH